MVFAIYSEVFYCGQKSRKVMRYTDLKPAILIMTLLLLIDIQDLHAQARLVLNGANITIAQGATLVIQNSNANAITRNSGYIISEGENNVIKWYIGTTTGNYTIPWGYSGDYIPLTFTPTGAVGSGYFLFSTYHTTNWNNAANLPTGVSNFNGSSGTDHSAFAIDRFWQINAQSYTTRPTLTSLAFTYRDSEHSAVGNTIEEAALRPERWNNTLSTWTDFSAEPTINTTTNTVTLSNLSDTDLFAWWTLSTSPVNRYWVAAALSNWSNRASWSVSPGGQGGATVPSSVDAVVFDGANDGSCTIDATVNIASLTVNAAYTGTITQGAQRINIVDEATLAGGSFVGGSVPIHVNGDLRINGTAFLSSSDTLDLKSNFTLDEGSFEHNSGIVKFSGTTAGAPQLINGSSSIGFNNIHITNTALNSGVSVESRHQLHGILTLATGAILDADGSLDTATFTMISSADEPVIDAAIAPLPAGAQVTGNITVQRYMSIEGPNNTRIYRYITSPVQGGTVADIQEEIPVTGTFVGSTNCKDCTTTQSMFAYNETVITDVNGSGSSDFNDGYIDFPDAVNTEVLQPGRGYTMFVRGNYLLSPVWDIRGVANQGNISLPVSFTSSGTIANDGWNLVGNPYPSVIDWNAATGWTKTNISGTIYIADNGGETLQYAIWNGTTGINGGSRYIPIGQAFWVKATAGSPVLSTRENIKAPGQSPTFFRTASTENLLHIKMTNGSFEDETAIHFRNDATKQFDDYADAWKLKNGLFNLSSLTENHERLAINSLPSLMCNTRVNLDVADAKPGAYQLKFSNMSSFEADASIILEDHYLNQNIFVSAQDTYPFTITDAPASKGDQRFTIVIDKPGPEVIISEEDGKLKIDYASNIQWYKDGNAIEGATASTYVPVESGIYSVTVLQGDCSLAGMREFFITGIEEADRGVRVYPVPISDKLYIEVAASRKLTSATVLDVFGHEIVKTDLQQESNGVYSAVISMKDYPSGSYVVQLKGKENIISRKVIKK
jgi:hypothetical protein